MFVAALKSCGLLVAVFAISLGTVGKLMPELFLKLPGPFGFLLYHIVGGKFLPPNFDNTPFLGDRMFEWVRDGDVVVSTGTKTGTTWVCYCSDAIRRKGSDKVGLPYTDIMMTTPWMESIMQPGETWERRSELYNTTVFPDGKRLKDYWDNEAFPFRVFKSHFLPVGSGDPYQSVLPIKKARKVKFISAMRHPDEYIKSILNFFTNIDPGVIKMWGGFPPVYESLDAAVKDHLPGQPLEALYLAYNKAWWPLRDEPNVLLMHYTDMVKDLSGLVRKLATFLEVDLGEAEFEAVKEKCSFQHMKTVPDAFNYRLLFHSDYQHASGYPHIMKNGTFVAKDMNAKKAAVLSEEAKKLWHDTLTKELDPELLSWLRTGGERAAIK